MYRNLLLVQISTKATQLEEPTQNHRTTSLDKFNFNATKIGKLYLWGKQFSRVQYVIVKFPTMRKKTNLIEWLCIRFRSMKKNGKKATNMLERVKRCYGTECAYYYLSFVTICNRMRLWWQSHANACIVRWQYWAYNQISSSLEVKSCTASILATEFTQAGITYTSNDGTFLTFNQSIASCFNMLNTQYNFAKLISFTQTRFYSERLCHAMHSKIN